MQKTVLFIILLICGVSAYSQQSNYIYIEAEKGQLFYVKIKDKVHSAESGGYIIIHGLTEDTCTLSIGFPKNEFPEQRFTVILNKSDKGYQLKNLGEKGWVLFDLQTMAVINGDDTQNATSDTNQVKKTDAFSTLLSKVVNDPAVLVETKKPVVKTAESPTGDSAKTKAVKPAAETKPVVAVATVAPPAKATGPIKLSEQQTESLYEAAYIVDHDTIRISYPIDKSIMTAPPTTPLADNTASDKPALKIANSDCKNFANDQDVDKLRVKILTQGDMDDKLSVAKKYFRTKCFTVKQIKALTELFTTDETKYQFFDVAYPFISDTENFYQLESSLENEYYKNRFRAMIKK